MEETTLELTTVLCINFSSNANGSQDNATQVAKTGEDTITTTSHGNATVSSPPAAGPDNVIDTVQFYCSVFGTFFICLGLCGNVLSILVWKRQRMRCSTGTYLIGQAIADICLLVFFFLTESLPSLSPEVTYSYSFGVFFSYVGYPFFYFFLVCSVWFTVGVTFDRFIQIQWPIKGKNFCNEKRAVIGLITMSVVNFIINIPHFATFTPIDSDGERAHQPTYRKSDFGKSTGSHHYEFWVHCVFLVLGSWLGILVLNILIIRHVAYVSKNMNNRKSSHGCKKTQRYESQMTRILLSVSITFLVLIFPECIAKCFYMLEAGDPDTVSKALSIAKTGIVINSSINFCLYCLSGKKFRKELRLLLSPCIHISDGTESKRMLPLSSGSSSGSFVKTKSTLWDTSRATKTL